jgi:DNA-nicking Smr family endonuclease
MSLSQVNDEALQFHWKTFPAQAKEFILTTLDNLSLKKLVEFWGTHAEYTSGSVAGGIYGASWYLALVYLHRNELSKARSLTLNGCFLQQCYYSGFDKISKLCTLGAIGAEQLPYFFAGFQATRSANDMYSFLQRSMPREYQQMLASFVNMGTKSRVMNFVGSVNEDWEGKSRKSSLKSSLQSNVSDDDDITLVIGDDTFRVSPFMPLKTVFNEYAENNSVSLKSLRFTYAGKTLFLSTAGKKTPDELHMLDNDVIEVHSTQEAEPSDEDKQTQKTKKTGSKKQKKSCKKTRSKPKKGSSKIEFVNSDEEYKEEHSRILTKLHDEADPIFKEIRQRLNALNLLKQQPKSKAQSKKAETNLYKSSKSLGIVSSNVSIIDLHGCTQEEAISRLNEGLKEWNELAMLGQYPFIHPVTIVCGAGGQVLSESVEKWIGQQHNVSNAPKTQIISKHRYAPAA